MICLVGLLAVDRASEPGVAVLLPGERDAFVPAGDLFAALARRADQHEAGDPFRVRERCLHRYDAAHRVPDEDRLVDAFGVEYTATTSAASWAREYGPRGASRRTVPALVDPGDTPAHLEGRREALPDVQRVHEAVQAGEVAVALAM